MVSHEFLEDPFDRIVGSPELRDLATTAAMPPWGLADQDDVNLHNNVAFAEARDNCRRRIEEAVNVDPLFSRMLSAAYNNLYYENTGHAFADHATDTRTLVRFANYVTGNLRGPEDLVGAFEIWDSEQQQRKDEMNRAFLAGVATGQLDTRLPPDVLAARVASAKAALDPEQRAQSQQMVLRTLYGDQYDAHLAADAAEV